MTTILQQIAHFVAHARTHGIDDSLRQEARRHSMDTLGIMLAASHIEATEVVEKIIEEWGGSPQASVAGRNQRYPAASAALLNGTAAHALDFDDTHMPSVLHPSASVVPAALAVAEAEQASGKDLLTAVAIGDELTVRIGMAGYDQKLGNSVFFEKGLHATSIAGTLGAAAAAAMLYQLSEEQIGHAIAIAASMGAGLLEANRTGGTVKRIHCGWAAHSGIVAATLARHGLTGPPTVFEGRFGFLQAYLGDQADIAALTRDLGVVWELPRIFFKPYPANHFTHAGIDAARKLRMQGLVVSEIEEIELRVAAAVLRTIGEPAEEKARPKTGYAAQFSGPFTVSTALLGGGGLGVGREDFTDETIHDPIKLALAARVCCVADEECNRIFPHQLPAILRVSLKDGSQREARVMVNRGGPDDPLSDDELAVKFSANAQAVLTAAQISLLRNVLQEIDRAPSLDRLMELVRASQ